MAAAAEVNLANVFSGTGITVDGKPFSGGLDGVGDAYSASLLAGTPNFNSSLTQRGTRM